MSLKEAEEEIKQLLKKLEKEVSSLHKRLKEDSHKGKKKIIQYIDMTKLMIDSYGIQIQDEGKNNQKDSLNGFMKEFTYLEKKAKDIIRDHNEEARRRKSSSRKKKEHRAGKMQKTELIQIGDRLQEKGLEKLERMNKELDDDNKLIQDVNIELRRQGEVLQSVDEDLNDIGSTLKRAQKYISYFSQEYYKDKFMRIMIILIGLLLIIIIVTAIVRKKKATAAAAQE